MMAKYFIHVLKETHDLIGSGLWECNHLMKRNGFL